MLQLRRFAPSFPLSLIACLFALPPSLAAQAAPSPNPGEPTDSKARRTWDEAREWERNRDYRIAMEEYLKANKQDGGHCAACIRKAYQLALRVGDYRITVDIAREGIAAASTDPEKAAARLLLGRALQNQAIVEKSQKYFQQSAEEFKTALALDPNLALTHYSNGITLAYLHQDEAARAEFRAFLDQDHNSLNLHERAARLAERVELARAPMAPPFSATTLDGRQVSLDSLTGKVVLIDFWATWCGPCRNALPHIQKIARKFDGQPLVILSISLDAKEASWRDFVEKNQMTWLQVRNGGSNGDIAHLFNVHGIPATFSIDADGVLEDQHVGDASIEGKLKKMVERAVELSKAKPPAPLAKQPGEGSD